ncbi:MAG: rubrerythrin family protein [Promethearchaeati archaeon SRVP18_Atabeyarchaeia-1]
MVKDMTEANLRSAYGGESQAHMRYSIYADRAKDKFPNVSRLFTAAAAAETIHATNHYKNIRSKGSTSVVSGAIFGTTNTTEDLQAGIDGESFEINEMYPVYITVAKFQAEKGAETSFSWALAAEKNHLALYQKAKQAVDKGKDPTLGPVQVCGNCGYTIEGNAPAKCPICGASMERFKAY